MENYPETPNADTTGWVRGFKLLLTLLSLLFAYGSMRGIFVTPGFERVFEDMLGDKNKLPVMTRFMIQNWLSLGMGTLAINFIGIAMIWISRRGFAICVTAAVLISVNFIIIQFTFSSLWSPMAEILRALSGGPETLPPP